MPRLILLLAFITLSISTMTAQDDNENLVQFTGVIMDGKNLQPIPYANIFDLTSRRGTYSDEKGFFTIVAEVNDTIEFSFIGYQTIEMVIPDTLEDKRYSIVQLMTRDAINLPETVIFPWPSREHFDIEFLAMNVEDPLEEAAAKNLSKKALRELQESVIADGDENADFYLRKQARSTYYQGQVPPQNIFSPVAWKGFIDAWKNGAFKKKRRE